MNIDKLKKLANSYYEKNNKTEYAEIDYSSLSIKSLLIIEACYSTNDPIKYLGKLESYTDKDFYSVTPFGSMTEKELEFITKENKKQSKIKQANYVFTDKEQQAKKEYMRLMDNR